MDLEATAATTRPFVTIVTGCTSESQVNIEIQVLRIDVRGTSGKRVLPPPIVRLDVVTWADARGTRPPSL
jgi:hypothetical protein